jgi:hypothetical protein
MRVGPCLSALNSIHGIRQRAIVAAIALVKLSTLCILALAKRVDRLLNDAHD